MSVLAIRLSCKEAKVQSSPNEKTQSCYACTPFINKFEISEAMLDVLYD